MKVKVYANEELTEGDLAKIRDILKESDCPHESLHKTFPRRYFGMENKEIHFNTWNWRTQANVYEIEY